MKAQKTAYLIALLLLCCATATRGAGPTNKILVGESRSLKWEFWIKDFVKRAEDEITFLLGTELVRTPVVFLPDKKLQYLGTTKLTIGLGAYTKPMACGEQIIRALFYRRSIEQREDPQLRPEHMPGWLVAACLHRINQDRVQDSLASHFDNTALLIEHNRLPSITSLLDHPLTAEDPLLFRLYGDICACIVRSVRRNNRDIIPDVFFAARPAIRQSILLRKQLRLKDDNAFQEWFIYAVNESVERDDRRLLSSKEVESRLTALEQVEVTHENGPTERMPIDQAIHEVEDYQIPSEFRAEFLKGCHELRFDVPHLLVPSVDKYIIAANFLVTGKDSKFARLLSVGREDLRKRHTQIIQISHYLRSFEVGAHSVGRQMGALYQTVPPRPPLAYERKLSTYLDTLEEQLNNTVPDLSR